MDVDAHDDEDCASSPRTCFEAFNITSETLTPLVAHKLLMSIQTPTTKMMFGSYSHDGRNYKH